MSGDQAEESFQQSFLLKLLQTGKRIREMAPEERVQRWVRFKQTQIAIFSMCNCSQSSKTEDSKDENTLNFDTEPEDVSDSEWETMSDEESGSEKLQKLLRMIAYNQRSAQSDEDLDENMGRPDYGENDYPQSDDSDEDIHESYEDIEPYKGEGCEDFCTVLTATLQQYGPQKLFSGNPLKWTKFWMAFERYRYAYWVLGRALTKEKQLVALKRFLAGEAHAAVEKFTGDQYDEAVTVLEEKYGKPELIEQACLKYIAELPKLKSDCLVDLKRLYSKIWDKLQYFAMHEDRRKLYSNQLVNGLLSKLPDHTRNKVVDRCKPYPMTPERVMSKFKAQLRWQALRMHFGV